LIPVFGIGKKKESRKDGQSPCAGKNNR